MEQVFVPSEQVLIPTEQVIVPSEQVIVPSEQVIVTSEQVLVPSKQVIKPSEQVFVPSEQVLASPFILTWFLPAPGLRGPPALSRFLSPNVLRPHLHHLDLQLRLACVGFTRKMEIKLTTAGNPVPFWETSSPAGGYSRPTCRPFCSFSSRGVL